MIGSGIANPRPQKGVSLIEGLTSLLILMVGVAGLAMAYQNTIYQSVSARNNTMAAQIAQSVLSELAASDPAGWDTAAIKNTYAYTYEGNRVLPTAADAYYQVNVTVTENVGFFDVEIGVIWTGWRAEEQKGGFANLNSNFAYVLNAMLSPQFSVTTGGATP